MGGGGQFILAGLAFVTHPGTTRTTAPMALHGIICWLTIIRYIPFLWSRTQSPASPFIRQAPPCFQFFNSHHYQHPYEIAQVRLDRCCRVAVNHFLCTA